MYPSVALYPLYGPLLTHGFLFPLRLSIFCMGLCVLNSTVSLYGSLSLKHSRALCPLYGPLSPLQPSVPL